MKFPTHIALDLRHNDHKTVYESVQDSIDGGDFDAFQWVSDDQKQKAIQTDECWTLMWHPITPVGFYALAACDLDALLDAAAQTETKP